MVQQPSRLKAPSLGLSDLLFATPLSALMEDAARRYPDEWEVARRYPDWRGLRPAIPAEPCVFTSVDLFGNWFC